jgi:multiple sugar transport system substrate-binding protein
VIRWWDHFLPIAPLHKQIWETFSKENPGVTVEYTQYNPPDLGKALQLAVKSGQMPDVFAIAGVGVPVARLQAENWFAPIDQYVNDEWKKRFPAGSLIEGMTTFGGKLYSFPIFAFRQYTTLDWFNKELMKNGGVDPEAGPKTQDEMRKAAKAIADKGSSGVVLPLQFVERMQTHVIDIAQVNGAAGSIDWKTGAYAYASDPFYQAFDFLLGFQKDNSLFAASSTLDARNGRARWATGAAGMFTDGPWNIGVLQTDFKSFMDKTGVAQIPVLDAGKPAFTKNAPAGGAFWVSATSKAPEVATKILQGFNTQDYYVGLANRMDQPPLDLNAVDKANVHPTYKQAMKFFQERARLAPEPLAKNPDVAAVQAEMKDIRPNLGEILQGAFSGDVKDYKAALKDYNDKLTAERDRALKVVADKGTKVSLEDWKFANWESDKDYTADLYPKR